MFFEQNDLCLTFKFKMATTNTHIKAVFSARELLYHKQHLFNGKLKKIDYVIRQIRLQGIRNGI